MKKRDTIFRKRKKRIAPFTFNRTTALVFDDMARRSIPGYEEMQAIVSRLCLAYYQQDHYIYDLGCSTGNSVLAIIQAFKRKRLPLPRVRAIDSSSEMIRHARSKCRAHVVEWQVAPVESCHFPLASVVIAHYVLQFIALDLRAQVIQRIFQGLHAGGILILSEKVCHPDAQIEGLLRTLYHEFKRDQGYSQLEIEQKEQALRGVLIPMPLERYRNLLGEAGFSSIVPMYTCLQFTSLVAMK